MNLDKPSLFMTVEPDGSLSVYPGGDKGNEVLKRVENYIYDNEKCTVFFD